MIVVFVVCLCTNLSCSSKSFVERMRVRLETDRVPEKASLESVLPGVNERLGGVESRMGRLEGRITNMLSEMKEDGRKTRSNMQRALQAAADVFAEKVRVSRPDMMTNDDEWMMDFV